MKKIFLTIAVLSILIVPEIILAQGGFVPCSGATCSACDFIDMANKLIVWLFGVLFVLFAGLMAVAGFGLVTSGGNQSALDGAKTKFQNAIIGIIIVMAAWIIVDTLLRGVLKGDSGEIEGYGPWSEIKCQKQTTPTESEIEPAGAVESGGGGSGTGVKLSQADAVSKLSPAGISVKPGAKLDGIQSHVIDGVIALNNECKCNITITEGTGGTHQPGDFSHANGYKLDLRTSNNPALVNYVSTKFTPAGSWSNGTKLYKNGNATYAIEKDHIDVVYK